MQQPHLEVCSGVLQQRQCPSGVTSTGTCHKSLRLLFLELCSPLSCCATSCTVLQANTSVYIATLSLVRWVWVEGVVTPPPYWELRLVHTTFTPTSNPSPACSSFLLTPSSHSWFSFTPYLLPPSLSQLPFPISPPHHLLSSSQFLIIYLPFLYLPFLSLPAAFLYFLFPLPSSSSVLHLLLDSGTFREENPRSGGGGNEGGPQGRRVHYWRLTWAVVPPTGGSGALSILWASSVSRQTAGAVVARTTWLSLKAGNQLQLAAGGGTPGAPRVRAPFSVMGKADGKCWQLRAFGHMVSLDFFFFSFSKIFFPFMFLMPFYPPCWTCRWWNVRIFISSRLISLFLFTFEGKSVGGGI